MAPSILQNFRLIAAQSSPLSDLGRLDYREGWFAITPKEDQTGETLSSRGRDGRTGIA